MTVTVVATVKDENGINLMILPNHSSQYTNCHVIPNCQLIMNGLQQLQVQLSSFVNCNEHFTRKLITKTPNVMKKLK